MSAAPIQRQRSLQRASSRRESPEERGERSSFRSSNASERSSNADPRKVSVKGAGQSVMAAGSLSNVRKSSLLPEKADSNEPGVSFLITLLTMLDFGSSRTVTEDDWTRGVRSLHCPGVGVDQWQLLRQRFDRNGDGDIDFGEIYGLAPLDPRLEELLRVVVQTLVILAEHVEVLKVQHDRHRDQTINKTLRHWKNDIQTRAFKAWVQDIENTKLKKRQLLFRIQNRVAVMAFQELVQNMMEWRDRKEKARQLMWRMTNAVCAKGFDLWKRSVKTEKADRLAKMNRAAAYMMHGLAKRVFNQWARIVYYDTKVQRFHDRWTHRRTANVYEAWHGLTLDQIKYINQLTGYAIGFWDHKLQMHTFRAYREAVLAAVDKRQGKVDKLLRRKGKHFIARLFEGWADHVFWKRSLLRKVLKRGSLVGMVWRKWQDLMMEAERQRQLRWLFGNSMEVLDNYMKEMQGKFETKLQEQHEDLGHRISSTTTLLRQEHEELQAEMSDKANSRTLEETKEMQLQLEKQLQILNIALSDQQKEAMTALEHGNGKTSELQSELQALAWELREQLQDTNREVQEKADMSTYKELLDQLSEVTMMKANHQEVHQIIAKLRRKGRAGPALQCVSCGATPAQGGRLSPDRPEAQVDGMPNTFITGISPRLAANRTKERPQSANPRVRSSGVAPGATGFRAPHGHSHVPPWQQPAIHNIPVEVSSQDGTLYKGSEQVWVNQMPHDAPTGVLNVSANGASIFGSALPTPKPPQKLAAPLNYFMQKTDRLIRQLEAQHTEDSDEKTQ